MKEKKEGKSRKESDDGMIGDDIHIEGAKVISEMLQVNTTLTSLYLGREKEQYKQMNKKEL